MQRAGWRAAAWSLAWLFTLVQAGAVEARIYHHHAVTHRSYAGGSDSYHTAVSGHRVHRPIQADARPSGATARCSDGSWSFSESHRGTCSHHGGVASWL